MKGELVIGAMVEFGGAGTFVSGSGRSVFERAAVVEIGGDAGGAEGVIADRRRNTGVPRAALKHAPGVGLRHRAVRKNSRAPVAGPEKHPLEIAGEGRGLDVVLQVGLEIMMAGHHGFLAAFFVESEP